MVYVVQRPGRTSTGFVPNLEPAEEYGELVYVFGLEDRISDSPNIALKKAREALAKFDPVEDYLLWPGVANPLALAACLYSIYENRPHQLRMLQWSRNGNRGARSTSQGGYIPVRFKFIKDNNNATSHRSGDYGRDC
jgi:hypothetical protein